jgi:microcystin-dependent protein
MKQGDTKTSAIQFDHYGWLVCDGRELSITDYSLLFGVIGGSGSTFRLPDPKGRVIGYIGQGDGLTNRASGVKVGAETETLDISEMPAHDHGGYTGISGEHTHTITDPGHAHSYQNSTNNQSTDNVFGTETAADDANLSQTTGTNTTGITINSAGDHSHTIASQGGGQPFSNMQPTLFFGNLFMYSGKRHTGIVANRAGRNIY